jgi:hypothetical protein
MDSHFHPSLIIDMAAKTFLGQSTGFFIENISDEEKMILGISKLMKNERQTFNCFLSFSIDHDHEGDNYDEPLKIMVPM